MKFQTNLRIIGGSLHGRRLLSPQGNAVRPTAGIAREALFNILSDRILESRFLDLYAGTGAIGLEAYSRGARSVTLIENSPVAATCLRRNVEDLCRGAAGKVQIYNQSVRERCDWLAGNKQTFDLIFVDPPYDQEGIKLVRLEPLLAPDGLLIYQRPTRRAVGDPFAGTQLIQRDLRHYGHTNFFFWESATREDAS